MSVFVTPSVGVGTALVGDFATSARIYRRGGLSVEATNSHDDWFVRNLSMIRAEERLALAVFRPSAFCSVTTLT
jgi:HK97 family phage major capsid protein